MNHNSIPNAVKSLLHKGTVIPALPLLLDANRDLDEKRQRVLLRYYLDAGVGGIAAAVHTTQFEIRQPEVNLYERVLKIACEEIDLHTKRTSKAVIKIAGVIGKTEQATKEAKIALRNGYHAVLLSLAAFKEENNQDILDHCKAVAQVMPVIGFYLQPAVGGRILDVDFWREFAKIENVIAIKMAPFNRYQTIDVVRAVAESGRADEIALYTGNDDNILLDLLSEYKFKVGNKVISKQIVGGLLGHWAVWTKKAVELLNVVQTGKYNMNTTEAIVFANQITDSNAAFFDAANNFSGCIAGIHEVLRRQGFVEGIWLLDPNEKLSPGQLEEIDRVYETYPDLNDDIFVSQNMAAWNKE